MAGDWIKWEKGLINKPEVAQIARALNLSRFETAARLMLVWEWADGITTDGHIDGMTAADVDVIAGHEGVASAMAATRPHPWLHIDDGGIVLPNYDRHNGDCARRRLLHAERSRAYRDRHRGPPPQRHASVTQASRP